MYTINASASGLWQIKTVIKTSAAPRFLWQFLFVINPRPKHLLYLDSTQKSYASQFWPSSCSVCILANVKWQHIFTHDIVSPMSKLQKLESTPYTPTHDTRSPDACESIAFHFWYRHACVVMYVLFTMWSKLWIDIFVLMMFLRKENFLCRFFLPSKKGNLGDKFARCLDFQESRADGEFSAVELQMPRSWIGEHVSPFFRSHQRERLAELKFGEWPPARLAALWTSSVSRDLVLFSGENDDQKGTPLLWPGTQEASICSATKRRATRIGTPSRRLAKMFHPQRSDKSPGSDGSGGTNFANLKKSCFK